MNAEKRALAEAERQARLDEKMQQQGAREDKTKPRISVVVPAETQMESAEPVAEEPKVESPAAPAESAAPTVSTPISEGNIETIQAEPMTSTPQAAPVAEESDANQVVPLQK